MGKHAHRSGKHAIWWSSGWVSMPTDQASMPCDGVLNGQACHQIRQACHVKECVMDKHATWWRAGG